MHWDCRKITGYTQEQLLGVYAQLSASRKEHVDRLCRQEDKLRSLAAEHLVRALLEEHYGISEAQLCCKPTGQPYLTNSQFYVSISHCEQMVACAVSEAPVGIDIERIRPIDLRISRHTCVPEELDYLQISGQGICSDAEVLWRFFEIWTAKEAYFKKCGTGITDLKGINILKLQRQVYTVEDYLIQIV